MVRASLGWYNNEEDVDALVGMVRKIARREVKGSYDLNPMYGRYEAEGYEPELPPGFGYLNGFPDARGRAGTDGERLG
jgi:hypothetical protein